MKSWTWSRCWVAASNRSLQAGFVGLLHKTNTERGRCGGQVKRSLLWRLHQVCVVCGGSPTKQSSSLVEPQSQDRRLGGRRRDPGAPESFEGGGTCDGIAGYASKGSKTAADGCPPDGNIHFLTKLQDRIACVPQILRKLCIAGFVPLNTGHSCFVSLFH
jgi:hypothetical protein